MEIKEYLSEFSKVDCACGKKHTSSVEDIIVKSGAVNDLPALIRKYAAKKPFVLADANTFSACGEKVCEILKSKGIACSEYVYSEPELAPDENAVGAAFMHFDKSCDLVIAVGSGVINDLGKILSNVTDLPYFIVATAPSMDGYASATSSMSMDGVKVSLPSKCPNVIIGDTDVLCKAPMKMLQAGLGDMLAKYISLAEWRIAHEIVGEYYCERIAKLVRFALKECVDNARGLLARDEVAVEAVFNGLVIGGVAMAFAGMSRPASGVEHYFSHVWDMRGLEFGTKIELHGIQCAVATKIAARLYEKLLNVVPDKEKALAFVKSFEYGKWAEELKDFIGKGALNMIELEGKEQKYDKDRHAKRLKIILQKWDIICNIIRSEIPAEKEIDSILDIIGAPKNPRGIGIDCDLFLTFKATKDIRDKYVLSRLLWDLGEIENFKNVITDRNGSGKSGSCKDKHHDGYL